MKDKYLTPSLKLKYQEDLAKVFSLTDDFWKIENDFLKERLININSNAKIQTLYSKYGNKNPSDRISYLQFAYVKEIELELFRKVIPELIYEFNQNGNEESICYYEFHEPIVKSETHQSRFEIACIDDNNYFDINSLKIYFEVYNNRTRDEFWLQLEEKLTKL